MSTPTSSGRALADEFGNIVTKYEYYPDKSCKRSDFRKRDFYKNVGISDEFSVTRKKMGLRWITLLGTFLQS
jgi:hypothetical protein